MNRYRFFVAVAALALLLPAVGCGSRNRCCAPRSTATFAPPPPAPCCPAPGCPAPGCPAPAPAPVGAGF